MLLGRGKATACKRRARVHRSRVRRLAQERTEVKLKPIENQVAVVMGASSGIGRETAFRLAKRGAKVVVAARSEAGLRSLEEIRRLGREASAVVADVSEFEQVEA